jgi:polygalacturonase
MHSLQLLTWFLAFSLATTAAGGMVRLPADRYLGLSFRLKSGITLQLDVTNQA